MIEPNVSLCVAVAIVGSLPNTRTPKALQNQWPYRGYFILEQTLSRLRAESIWQPLNSGKTATQRDSVAAAVSPFLPSITPVTGAM
jgi:hypothetical protein